MGTKDYKQTLFYLNTVFDPLTAQCAKAFQKLDENGQLKIYLISAHFVRIWSSTKRILSNASVWFWCYINTAALLSHFLNILEARNIKIKKVITVKTVCAYDFFLQERPACALIGACAVNGLNTVVRRISRSAALCFRCILL